jgi:hypothetical protein
MTNDLTLAIYRKVTALGWVAYRQQVAGQVADGILTPAEGVEMLAYAKRYRTR